jgi:DNA-directed RNA polymerase subunit RPC12/RpoP
MHTMAFRLPHPCEHCGTLMERSLENGIRCAQCGHTEYDMGETAICTCPHCSSGAQA